MQTVRQGGQNCCQEQERPGVNVLQFAAPKLCVVRTAAVDATGRLDAHHWALDGSWKLDIRRYDTSFQAPAELAAEEVHGILRQVVGMVLNGAACEGLQRFPALQREIAGTTAGALAAMCSEAFQRLRSWLVFT